MDRKGAEKIYAQGKEATILALLELAAENKTLLVRVDELERSLMNNTVSLADNNHGEREIRPAVIRLVLRP